MKLIIFKINKSTAFVLKSPQILSKSFRYDEICILLNQDNENKYILYEDFFIAGLRDLDRVISNALLGKLVYKENEPNIGFAWNEELAGKDLPVTIDAKGNKFWVGQKFILFDSPELLTTWLYEKNKKFWIEITPVYPWHHRDPKKDENFITYEEFMKDYKPIALFEVSHETLKEWLKRVQELLVIVEANDSKYLKKDGD